MRFQCSVKTRGQVVPPASPSMVRTAALPVKRLLTRQHELAVRGAIASAVLLASTGCAMPGPGIASAWDIEPVLSVKHTIHSSQAYYTMGRYYDGSQAWGKSIDAYRKAIAADAQNIEAYNALGVALAQSGRYADAETTLRQAIAIDPARTHMRSNLGYVLLLAGKPSEAVTELKAVVKQNGGDATALANLREAMARADAAQHGNAADGETAASKEEAVTSANSSKASAVAPRVSVDVDVDVDGVAFSGSVPTPIPAAEVRAPLTASVTVPMPLQLATAPGSQTVGAGVPPVPESVGTVPSRPDRPTAAAPKEHVAIVDIAVAARPQAQSVPVAVRAEDLGAKRQASRLEVTNGNGVAGMARLVGRWLATQGLDNVRLTNQRPFAQQTTLIQYRSGHEEEARRVARSLPAGAKALAGPTQGLRSDVRVVLGRDWIQTAICLEHNTCQPMVDSVAIAHRQ
jgi:hypothetical protein